MFSGGIVYVEMFSAKCYGSTNEYPWNFPLFSFAKSVGTAVKVLVSPLAGASPGRKGGSRPALSASFQLKDVQKGCF